MSKPVHQPLQETIAVPTKEKQGARLFVTRLGKLLGGALGGQAFVLAFMPVITRIFSPADFSSFAILMSTAGVISIVAAARYDFAIPLQRTERSADGLTALSVFLLCALVLLVLLPVCVTGALLAPRVGQVEFLWHLIPIGVVALGLFQIFSYRAVREHDYNRLSMAKLLVGIVTPMVAIGLGVLVPRPESLVAGFLSGYLVGATALSIPAWRTRLGPYRHRVALARRNRSAATVSLPSSFINSIGSEAPQILVPIGFGAVVGGNYSLTNRLVLSPLGLISRAWTQLYIGQFSALVRQGSRGLVTVYLSHLWKLGIVFLPIIAFGYLIAPMAIPFIFGPQWQEAGTYVRVLAPFYLAYVVVVPLSQTLVMTGDLGAQLGWDIVRTCAVTGTLAACILLNIPAVATLGIFSVVCAFCYVGLAVLTITRLKKHERPDRSR